MNINEAIEKLKAESWEHEDHFCRNVVSAIDLDVALEIISQIETPPKLVIIPKFVAEWIEERKLHDIKPKTFSNKVAKWLNEHDYNEYLYYKAWYEGYEIGKEQLYTVKVIKTSQYLHKIGNDYTFITHFRPKDIHRMTFTKSELNQIGFNGVFNNPMFEVKEVNNDTKI